MRVGALDVTAVDDGVGRVTPAQLYAAGGKERPGKGARDEDWAEHTGFLSSAGQLEMPVGTFLIRAGERVVLVDAGYGPQAPATVSGARLPENLAAEGIGPADVTDVVLTHLHTDHIGWCAVDGVPTFPNATYRCAAADWAYFVAGTGDTAFHRFAASTLAPIEDRFDTWAGESTLAPGLDVVPAAGHTPGSATIVLTSQGERAVLLGDVVHHPVQLLDDAWERVVDVDETAARRAQRAIVADLIRDRTPVVGAHFPGLRFGLIVDRDGRRRWEPLP
jgi:glyoxylase-like metal-dependent hydrolase (beta-lactamase superfamily II)